MILSWPISAPTLTVSLRDPELGNTDRYDSNAIIRENRSKEPITFKAVEWPVNVVRSFTITTITQTIANELTTFFEQSAADEVFVADHDGEVWQGVIITPIPEIITVKDTCSYDVTFELMGRQVA